MEAHLWEGVDAFRVSAEVRTIGHLPAGGKGGWATQGKARKAPRGDGPALQRAQRREDSRKHRVIPALGGQVTAGGQCMGREGLNSNTKTRVREVACVSTVT